MARRTRAGDLPLTELPDPVPTLPADLVEGAGLFSDRDVILPLLPRGGLVVDVGVALGAGSRKLINTFRLHELPLFWGRPPSDYVGHRTHGDFYRDIFPSSCAVRPPGA